MWTLWSGDYLLGGVSPLSGRGLISCQLVTRDREEEVSKYSIRISVHFLKIKVTNFVFLYYYSQFHRILENWLPGDIERNSWNISSPGSMSLWILFKLFSSMLSLCSSPIISFFRQQRVPNSGKQCSLSGSNQNGRWPRLKGWRLLYPLLYCLPFSSFWSHTHPCLWVGYLCLNISLMSLAGSPPSCYS